MRPFFVKAGSSDTVWFCQPGGFKKAVSNTGGEGQGAVQALALLSNTTNGADGHYYNDDGAEPVKADIILEQFT